MRRLILGLLLLAPLTAFAQDVDPREGKGRAIWMNDLLGDRDFFEPWGIGINYFTMDQDYTISDLTFTFPGIPAIDTEKVAVANDIQHFDLKLDVWLTPFLNVFAILGAVDGETVVDLSEVDLPFPLKELPIDLEGTVYGVGFNLVYGSERWFAALNTTWTDTDLDGDWNSSAETITAQPRIGIIKDKWTVWAGGMWLDIEERHTGQFQLPIPGTPPVIFDATLETKDKWNYGVGVGYIFGPKAHLSLELGFGDREHTLFNFAYRF